RNIMAATVAAIFFATSAPIAETVRGNFGKSENIMLFFFFLGLAVFQEWQGKKKTQNTKDTVVGIILCAGALASFLLSCLAKESGKLIGGLLILYALLSWILRRATMSNVARWFLLLTGIGGIVLNYAANSQCAAREYIKNYFTLNFGYHFLADSLSIYR